MSSPSDSVADALADAAQDINSRRDLADILHSIVHSARTSLPGVDHVGISITHRDGLIETLAATDEVVLALDGLQYALNEGPCLQAMREEDVVVVNHADREARWPRYMDQARELGLRSQMGLRLYRDHETLGGLNLYAMHEAELDADVIHNAQLFATHAALAMGKARTDEDLSAGIVANRRVGQAVGILMVKYDLDESRAFQYLVRVSQSSNVKLRDVAEEVVQQVNSRNGVPAGGARVDA
jgi:GAF domain-containing protein